MKVLTVAGTPSSGKTSVVLAVSRLLKADGCRIAAVKFDALTGGDEAVYSDRLGIPALLGLSEYVCPDHYYVSNLEEAFAWGLRQAADVLFIETAGLCFRCAPHIRDVPALTVVDALGGLAAPEKMGPALSCTDMVAVTKGDLISQAEREVLCHRIRRVSPGVSLFYVNGLTGRGALLLKRVVTDLQEIPSEEGLTDRQLRYSMPAAVCSYCTGETRIGQRFQSGNVEKLRPPG